MDLNVIKLNNDQRQIITNEVVSNDRTFYQLISVDNDESDFIFAERIENELIPIEDQILIIKLLEEMCNNTTKNI